jgi:hypothetical protein
MSKMAVADVWRAVSTTAEQISWVRQRKAKMGFVCVLVMGKSEYLFYME